MAHALASKHRYLKKTFVILSYLMALLGSCLFSQGLHAQMITGTWHGKINRQKVELKIVQKGDSLVGTSYYYQSASSYKRYSIKGYFDGVRNEAVWWDDVLLEEKNGRFTIGAPGKSAFISHADFNCPGANVMKLDGNSRSRDTDGIAGEVHLDKTRRSIFTDEWDFVIDHYTVGANHPDIIDSVASIADAPVTSGTPVTPSTPVVASVPVMDEPLPAPVAITEPVKQPDVPRPLTIEEKFTTRQKVPAMEIPITGDSIEVNFYDNAEVDGDSISLFLNERLIFKHIYLTEKAFTVKFAVSDLVDTNELVMVAENLGSIPPNTSFMVAYVNGQRYEARLVSTEGSSAMIRFVKRADAIPSR